MKLILSKTSIHAKYYKWFYFASTLPDNLCSYFWLLIISFMLIPVVILCWPSLIVEIFDKKQIVIEDWVDRIKTSFFTYMVIFCIAVYIKLWATEAEQTALWTCIVILTIAALIIGIILIRKWLNREPKESPKEPKPKTTSFPSMTWQWIKAKKNKYCPRIEWL